MALVTAAQPHPKAKFRKKSELKIFTKWDSEKGGPVKKNPHFHEILNSEFHFRFFPRSCNLHLNGCKIIKSVFFSNFYTLMAKNLNLVQKWAAWKFRLHIFNFMVLKPYFLNLELFNARKSS